MMFLSKISRDDESKHPKQRMIHSWEGLGLGFHFTLRVAVEALRKEAFLIHRISIALKSLIRFRNAAVHPLHFTTRMPVNTSLTDRTRESVYTIALRRMFPIAWANCTWCIILGTSATYIYIVLPRLEFLIGECMTRRALHCTKTVYGGHHGVKYCTSVIVTSNEWILLNNG